MTKKHWVYFFWSAQELQNEEEKEGSRKVRFYCQTKESNALKKRLSPLKKSGGEKETSQVGEVHSCPLTWAEQFSPAAGWHCQGCHPFPAWIHAPVSSQPCTPSLLLLCPCLSSGRSARGTCPSWHGSHLHRLSLDEKCRYFILQTPQSELQPHGCSNFFLGSGGLDLCLPQSWGTARLEPVSIFSREHLEAVFL